MFSTFPKQNLNFSFTFVLLSANAFNLDQSKILSFGKELKCLQLHGTSSKFKSTFILKNFTHRNKNIYVSFICFAFIG